MGVSRELLNFDNLTARENEFLAQSIETHVDVLFIVRITISYVGLAIVMFGMGCFISMDDFSRKEMHLPQSVMIGLGLQYFIQPLVGYLLALILDMGTFDALSIIMLAVCPVSPFCSVLVYYGGGFVTVGLCLSMFSTALSIGLIPFWFSFYSSAWSNAYYVIGTPREILITEVIIFIPTGLGVLFKRLAGEKRARKVAKICSFAFVVTVVVCPILNGINHPNHYIGAWQLWVGGCLLPFVGFIFGLILASFFKLPYEACSAVSLAVGTPNWFIASAMAWNYFGQDENALHEVLTLVSIFSISMPIEGFIWSVAYYGVEELIRKIYPKIVMMFDDPDSDDELEVTELDEEMKRKKERVVYILGQVLDDEEEY
ncbi:ileal sodium/bile acid cotransporter-like isoform X2 [Lytechinus variegatus]|nr:ileal sodium/bile acid cotransporter-like isoform X2 [Lytechinus variegatus]